jgi:tRNA nucleotidyltransferase (CCA-adding enzyme)
MDLINKVLERIKPSEEEHKRTIQLAKNVIDELKSLLDDIDAEPMLVGSVAKGTNLKNADVDIFIRYSPKYDRSTIEKKTIELGKKILKNPLVNYAEHPYVRGKFEDVDFEIVPCYRVEESNRKITSVDRTPFHTEFILKNLREWQRDEVRLLKQFLKGIGIYGAEARVEGFSGYLTELLVIKFGTFMDVLKNAQRWKRKTHISLDNTKKDFESPLIFIDPVDPNRNVASAVSIDNYSLLIFSSMEFLKNPNEKFFFPGQYKEFDLRKIDERGTKILHIWMKRPQVVDDILFPQIRKFARYLSENLMEFSITKIGYYVDNNVHLIIESYYHDLPPLMVHEGPPVWSKNSEDFIKKWKGRAFNGPYIMNGKFFADIERRNRKIEDAIMKLISSGSIGKDLDKLKETIVFSRDPSTIDLKELSRVLDYRFPWEL